MKLTADIRLFRRTLALESEIDKFLDLLSEGAILFKYAVQVYLTHGNCDQFEEKLYQVNKIESSADHLRRSIETQLYSQTLIPDARGDVLGLLENLDNITNRVEGTLWAFSIENPDGEILSVDSEYELHEYINQYYENCNSAYKMEFHTSLYGSSCNMKRFQSFHLSFEIQGRGREGV